VTEEFTEVYSILLKTKQAKQKQNRSRTEAVQNTELYFVMCDIIE